ncbi:MAG: type I restriction enzyme HsdR N-terminal domain-containing protein [Bacteroidota bacterium]
MKVLDIDFSQYASALKIKTSDKQRMIFDPVRRKYLVLSPEEFVRQLLIHFLIHDLHYNPNRISIERQLLVNGRTRRYDILIYDPALQPFLLIECKAPDVPLSQDTFDQIARYNMPLQVPYLLVSNGRHNLCCQIHYEQSDYEYLDQLPDYPEEAAKKGPAV